MLKEKQKMLVVIGASRLGAQIASDASQRGISTCIIDIDQASFKKLDASYSGFTINGDAMDSITLEKAKIKDATEVVIATRDDDTNIFLACSISELYPVPHVIVRLRDEQKRELLTNEKIEIISTSSLSLQAYQDIKNKIY